MKKLTQPVTTFDLTRITAREMPDFQRAMTQQDTETVAAFLAKIVVNCPHLPADADAHDPETYLELPYYGAFQAVVDDLGEATKNAVRR